MDFPPTIVSRKLTYQVSAGKQPIWLLSHIIRDNGKQWSIEDISDEEKPIFITAKSIYDKWIALKN